MFSANPLPKKDMSIDDFLKWEIETKDTLDFKRIYIDIAGDLVAGLALSEIVYWHLPDKNGDCKLRVQQKGRCWIASTRYEWWDRARISPKQIDRALKILREKQIIETAKFKFKGEPTTHIRLLVNPFLKLLSEAINQPIQNPYLPKQAKPVSPKGDSPIAYKELMNSLQEGTPITENTTLGTSNKIIVSRQKFDDDDKCIFGAKYQDGVEDKNIELDLGQDGVEDNELVDRAIGEVWNTISPGRIEVLRKTLLGQHPPDSKDCISNVTPPATANEILQMGEYFKRQYPDAKMPTTPSKMQDWLYQSREKDWRYLSHKNYLIDVEVKFPLDLLNNNDYEGVLRFLQRYHPNEYARFQKDRQYIDSLPPAIQNMVLRPEISYREITITVSCPLTRNEIVAADDDFDEFLACLEENHPIAYTEVRKTMNDIDHELDD